MIKMSLQKCSGNDFGSKAQKCSDMSLRKPPGSPFGSKVQEMLKIQTPPGSHFASKPKKYSKGASRSLLRAILGTGP